MNLFDSISIDPSEERFQTLVEHAGVRVERITSKGHVTPEGEWYDQPGPEWVLVAEGAAELTLADPEEVVRLARGDWFFIPARRRHRVTWTDPAQVTIWLAIHWLPSAPADY